MTAFVATCAVEDRGRTCDAPTQAFLCDSHRDELVSWLWDIGGLKLDDRGQYLPSLLDELDTTITGDDKIGGASIGIIVHSSETRLPFNEHASDVKHSLCNSVVGWTRLFAEDNPHLLFDVSTIEEAARWMAGFPNLLAGQVAAVEMHDEIRQWVTSARRSIDRPAQRVYAGRCGAVLNDVECAEQLFALEHRHEVVCPTCGTEHHVEDRRAQILKGLRAQRATARVIADALKGFAGIGINVKSIRTWGRRGLLTNYAADPERDQPIHEIGETLDHARSVKAARESACVEAA